MELYVGQRSVVPRPDEPTASAESPAAITLGWLVRLRWGAVVGQVATIAVAAAGLGLELPVTRLGLLVAAAALSNVALTLLRRRVPDVSASIPGAVLAADTLVLTGLLYLTGGPSNPFSVLYLVHVTLAAVVLGMRWAAAIVAISVISYAALFFWHVPNAHMEHAHHGGSAFSFHLQGMWIAFTVAASLIAYFVTRLAASLRAREAELARAEQIAARTEKLASLSTLAAGAAHELGTPLGTIAVAAKELERSIRRDPEEAAADAKLIRAEVDRCRAIIRRMGTQAGEAMGEVPECITPGRVLSLTSERLGAAGAARVDFVDDARGASLVCPVEGLAQVLVSLVQNALYASEDRVRLAASAGDGVVRFTVEDRGAGVPEALLARLGEPFFTTKPPGEGMGLGLFLANAFAARSGGKLVFSSREGEGTRVVLELPNGS